MRTAIEGLTEFAVAGWLISREECLLIADKHDSAHAQLHAELVALRLAHATIEAERNRLADEVAGWERLADTLAAKASEEACQAVKDEFRKFDIRKRLLTAERDAETARANNYELSSQEHAQRAEELAAKLERVHEFSADLERKGVALRKESGNSHPGGPNYNRYVAKASTYEAEARSLLAILDGK